VVRDRRETFKRILWRHLDTIGLRLCWRSLGLVIRDIKGIAANLRIRERMIEELNQPGHLKFENKAVARDAFPSSKKCSRYTLHF
jgi:hypothetical protein